jgi:diguanylate cyclase (GGDEF)-like protein/PAS domain S-box-containing protein
MQRLLERLLTQPFIGVLSILLGIGATAGAWSTMPSTRHAFSSPFPILLASALTILVVLAYRFPIHIWHEAKVYMASVPLYLMAVLLFPPLAMVAAGLGKFGGEMAVRKQTGGYMSDIASQVGRWILVAFAGSIVAHISIGIEGLRTVPLVLAGAVLWLGDIVTCPVLLCPVSGLPPRRIIIMVGREAGPAEAAQYLIGILGGLAALQAAWGLILLFLPTAFIYRAFKSAKDMHESTKHLLASVVETSTDAILLLDTDGSVIRANKEAAALYGYADPDDMLGISVFQTVSEEEQERARADVAAMLETGSVKEVQYALTRQDESTFLAEVSWLLIADKQGRPKAMTSVARDITHRRRMQLELEHQALHDALTGLPNRTLFAERMEQALLRGEREGIACSVFLMDLNRFKQVNDTYGHHHGDELLKAVAGRIRALLRESDTVARLGGDEFAVLLPKADAHGATLVAERIVNAIAEPFVIEGQTLDVGTSIGIAVFPDHGRDAETLINQADAAMYVAKRAREHRGGFRFHADVGDRVAVAS